MVHGRVRPSGGLQLLWQGDAVHASHIHDAVAYGIKMNIHLSSLLKTKHAERESRQGFLPAANHWPEDIDDEGIWR